MSILESERLILRPPRPSDLQAISVWLGDYDVAKMTARAPWPYGEADAEDFIAQCGMAGSEPAFAITHKVGGQFLGMIALHPGHEFGYWLGKPFWGQGYATEAADRLVRFAFEAQDRAMLHAGWFYDNPASGRVLSKLGARHNGSALRDCVARGQAVLCHDMVLTRAEFLRKQAA